MISDAVIVAIIGAISTVIGVIITNRNMLEKQAAMLEKEIAVYQAKTDERITELTREVREHNEVVKRTYRLEEKVAQLEKRPN